MENLELYVNSVNQIFACLENLDQSLENEENSANIKNLIEYKELAISFAKLIGSNVNNQDNVSDMDTSLDNHINNDDDEGDSNDW